VENHRQRRTIHGHKGNLRGTKAEMVKRFVCFFFFFGVGCFLFWCFFWFYLFLFFCFLVCFFVTNERGFFFFVFGLFF